MTARADILPGNYRRGVMEKPCYGQDALHARGGDWSCHARAQSWWGPAGRSRLVEKTVITRWFTWSSRCNMP